MRQLAISVLIGALLPSAVVAKEPKFTGYSQKGVRDLSGCVALKLAEQPAYRVLKKDIAGGVELRMKFAVAGIPATAATFIISDEGTRRKMTIYATGRTDGAPRQIAAQTQDCL